MIRLALTALSLVLVPQVMTAKVKQKTIALSLPLTMAVPLRLEYNLRRGSISLDYLPERSHQRLLPKVREQNPELSLETKAQEFGIMVSRYSTPEHLSGFNWGLGIGYRQENVDWRKETLTDDTGLSSHRFNVKGVTASMKLGYRYVAESLGFMAGLFLFVKHFEGRVSDGSTEQDGDRIYTASTPGVRDSLARQLKTRIMPISLEIGWAF